MNSSTSSTTIVCTFLLLHFWLIHQKINVKKVILLLVLKSCFLSLGNTNNEPVIHPPRWGMYVLETAGPLWAQSIHSPCCSAAWWRAGLCSHTPAHVCHELCASVSQAVKGDVCHKAVSVAHGGLLEEQMQKCCDGMGSYCQLRWLTEPWMRQQRRNAEGKLCQEILGAPFSLL